MHLSVRAPDVMTNIVFSAAFLRGVCKLLSLFTYSRPSVQGIFPRPSHCYRHGEAKINVLESEMRVTLVGNEGSVLRQYYDYAWKTNAKLLPSTQ
jgi:hypothetical protein